MCGSVDVASTVETLIIPDCVEMTIRISGQSDTRERCVARYNELVASIKFGLELKGFRLLFFEK